PVSHQPSAPLPEEGGAARPGEGVSGGGANRELRGLPGHVCRAAEEAERALLLPLHLPALQPAPQGRRDDGSRRRRRRSRGAGSDGLQSGVSGEDRQVSDRAGLPGEAAGPAGRHPPVPPARAERRRGGAVVPALLPRGCGLRPEAAAGLQVSHTLRLPAPSAC
ncbi:unnamed protein product, partial [Tetraodon nigroviridis]